LENHDLEIAKLKIREENLSLVIVKQGKVVFRTNKPGIGGFLQAIQEKKSLVGVSAADKIVGVAAALLCVYSGVASVFALTISEGGIRVLEDNNINCLFEKKVSNIMNRNKTDVCPFEKMVKTSQSPNDAYLKLKFLANQLMKKSTSTN
jgi:hypothetical protein